MPVLNLHAASRTSASYRAVTETVDMTGGISTSASYSTIDSAGVISGVATVGSPAMLAKSGYIGQFDEVDPPEIEVRRPPSILQDGGTKDFGLVAVNGNTNLVFTIKTRGLVLHGARESLSTGRSRRVHGPTRHACPVHWAARPSPCNLLRLRLVPRSPLTHCQQRHGREPVRHPSPGECIGAGDVAADALGSHPEPQGMERT